MTAVLPARRLRAPALLLTSALALGACASVPDLGPLPQPKALLAAPEARPQTPPAAPGPAGVWPGDGWWRAYGDPQLDALIAEGLAGAPDLAQAQARLRRAEAFAQQSGAARYPQATAKAQATQTKDSVFNGLPPGLAEDAWRDQGAVSLDLSYELDFWGRNRATFAAATSEAEAARAEAAAARLAISTGVAAAYAELARLHAGHDAALATARTRQETADLIRVRFAEGLETRAALRRADAGLAAAQADIAAAEESLELARNQIAALIGAPPERGRSIGRPMRPAVAAFGLPADLEADLIGRRPDLAAQRLRAEAAAQRIKAARADFYPNVRISALVGLSAIGLTDLTSAGADFASVGPAISLPVFSGGRIEGAYRGARADYDAAVAGYDATLVRALREVADAAASRRALDARLARSQEALEASDEAWRLAMDRYRGGLSPYLDVLSAEDVLVLQRRAVADLQARAFALDVALVRALGGGFRAPVKA